MRRLTFAHFLSIVTAILTYTPSVLSGGPFKASDLDSLMWTTDLRRSFHPAAALRVPSTPAINIEQVVWQDNDGYELHVPFSTTKVMTMFRSRWNMKLDGALRQHARFAAS